MKTKLTALITAFVLAITLLTVNVSAAGSLYIAQETYAETEEIVKVNIILSDNPGISDMSCTVRIDPRELRLLNVENGDLIGDFTYQIFDNIILLQWHNPEMSMTQNGLLSVLTFATISDIENGSLITVDASAYTDAGIPTTIDGLSSLIYPYQVPTESVEIEEEIVEEDVEVIIDEDVIIEDTTTSNRVTKVTTKSIKKSTTKTTKKTDKKTEATTTIITTTSERTPITTTTLVSSEATTVTTTTADDGLVIDSTVSTASAQMGGIIIGSIPTQTQSSSNNIQAPVSTVTNTTINPYTNNTVNSSVQNEFSLAEPEPEPQKKGLNIPLIAAGAILIIIICAILQAKAYKKKRNVATYDTGNDDTPRTPSAPKYDESEPIEVRKGTSTTKMS